MSKKRELRVAYRWAAYHHGGGLYQLEKRKDQLSWHPFRCSVAIVPRGRYRELCAAEREGDALRCRHAGTCGDYSPTSQKGGKP